MKFHEVAIMAACAVMLAFATTVQAGNPAAVVGNPSCNTCINFVTKFYDSIQAADKAHAHKLSVVDVHHPSCADVDNQDKTTARLCKMLKTPEDKAFLFRNLRETKSCTSQAIAKLCEAEPLAMCQPTICSACQHFFESYSDVLLEGRLLDAERELRRISTFCEGVELKPTTPHHLRSACQVFNAESKHKLSIGLSENLKHWKNTVAAKKASVTPGFVLCHDLGSCNMNVDTVSGCVKGNPESVLATIEKEIKEMATAISSDSSCGPYQHGTHKACEYNFRTTITVHGQQNMRTEDRKKEAADNLNKRDGNHDVQVTGIVTIENQGKQKDNTYLFKMTMHNTLITTEANGKPKVESADGMFSKGYFYFNQDCKGRITHTAYPKSEDSTIINVKKNVASMFHHSYEQYASAQPNFLEVGSTSHSFMVEEEHDHSGSYIAEYKMVETATHMVVTRTKKQQTDRVHRVFSRGTAREATAQEHGMFIVLGEKTVMINKKSGHAEAVASSDSVGTPQAKKHSEVKCKGDPDSKLCRDLSRPAAMEGTQVKSHSTTALDAISCRSVDAKLSGKKNFASLDEALTFLELDDFQVSTLRGDHTALRSVSHRDVGSSFDRDMTETEGAIFAMLDERQLDTQAAHQLEMLMLDHIEHDASAETFMARLESGLKHSLKHHSAAHRRIERTITTLYKAGTAKAQDFLIRVMKDNLRNEVGARIAFGAMHLHRPSVEFVEAFRAIVWQTEKNNRHVHVMALNSLGALAHALSHENAEGRVLSSEIVAEMEAKLQDEDTTKLSEINALLGALGNSKAQSAAQVIQKFLKHEDESVRASAHSALRHWEEKESLLEIYLNTINDLSESDSVRKVAAQFLSMQENIDEDIRQHIATLSKREHDAMTGTFLESAAGLLDDPDAEDEGMKKRYEWTTGEGDVSATFFGEIGVDGFYPYAYGGLDVKLWTMELKLINLGVRSGKYCRFNKKTRKWEDKIYFAPYLVVVDFEVKNFPWVFVGTCEERAEALGNPGEFPEETRSQPEDFEVTDDGNEDLFDVPDCGQMSGGDAIDLVDLTLPEAPGGRFCMYFAYANICFDMNFKVVSEADKTLGACPGRSGFMGAVIAPKFTLSLTVAVSLQLVALVQVTVGLNIGFFELYVPLQTRFRLPPSVVQMKTLFDAAKAQYEETKEQIKALKDDAITTLKGKIMLETYSEETMAVFQEIRSKHRQSIIASTEMAFASRMAISSLNGQLFIRLTIGWKWFSVTFDIYQLTFPSARGGSCSGTMFQEKSEEEKCKAAWYIVLGKTCDPKINWKCSPDSLQLFCTMTGPGPQKYSYTPVALEMNSMTMLESGSTVDSKLRNAEEPEAEPEEKTTAICEGDSSVADLDPSDYAKFQSGQCSANHHCEQYWGLDSSRVQYGLFGVPPANAGVKSASYRVSFPKAFTSTPIVHSLKASSTSSGETFIITASGIDKTGYIATIMRAGDTKTGWVSNFIVHWRAELSEVKEFTVPASQASVSADVNVPVSTSNSFSTSVTFKKPLAAAPSSLELISLPYDEKCSFSYSAVTNKGFTLTVTKRANADGVVSWNDKDGWDTPFNVRYFASFAAKVNSFVQFVRFPAAYPKGSLLRVIKPRLAAAGALKYSFKVLRVYETGFAVRVTVLKQKSKTGWTTPVKVNYDLTYSSRSSSYCGTDGQCYFKQDDWTQCNNELHHMCKSGSCARCYGGSCNLNGKYNFGSGYMCSPVGSVPIGKPCNTDVMCVSGSCSSKNLCSCNNDKECPYGARCIGHTFYANVCACGPNNKCPGDMICFSDNSNAECWGKNSFVSDWGCWNYRKDRYKADNEVCKSGQCVSGWTKYYCK